MGWSVITKCLAQRGAAFLTLLGLSMQRLAFINHPLAWLLLLAGFFMLAGLNRVELRGSTEPREAGIAAYMLLSGDYLTPRLNGRPFLEKPPLSYWLQAASIAAFGDQPFAPRLPSALAGIGTVLLLYLLRKPSSTASNTADVEFARILPGLMLLTAASFWMTARTAGQDTLLAFGITLALLAYYLAHVHDKTGYWLLYAGGLAIAVLTKGIVGVAIPAFIILAFLLHERFIEHRAGLREWLRPCAYGVLALLPFALWLIALFHANGIAAVNEILIANSLGRFQGGYSQGAHAEPFYYYLAILPETFQPWLILFFMAVAHAFKTTEKASFRVFTLCWIFAAYFLLTLSAGKRPSYLIMLYPAVALLVAGLLNDTRLKFAGTQPTKTFFTIARVHLLCFALAALYLGIKIIKTSSVIGGCVFLLLAAGLCFHALRASRINQQRYFLVTAALLLTTYYAYYSFVLPRAESGKSMRAVVDKLAEYRKTGRPIALYKPMERLEGGVSFYLREQIPVAGNPSELNRLLAANPGMVLLAVKGDSDIANLRVLETIDYSDMDYVYLAGD